MPVETKEKDLGTCKVRLTQLEPRQSLRTFVTACAIFGEEGVRMITKGVITITDKKDGKGKEVKVDMTLVLAHVVKSFAKASPDDVLTLADELLLGCCSVKLPGAGWDEIPAGDAGVVRMNELFPSVYALLGAVREALTHNYLPTFAGKATGENTSESGAEAEPEQTETS